MDEEDKVVIIRVAHAVVSRNRGAVQAAHHGGRSIREMTLTDADILTRLTNRRHSVKENVYSIMESFTP
jgi:hypothetical protein